MFDEDSLKKERARLKKERKRLRDTGEQARIAYIDATDFDHELGEAAGGTRLYGSLGDIHGHSPCIKECGVYLVKVLPLEKVVPSSFDLSDEDQLEAVKASLKHYESKFLFHTKQKDLYRDLTIRLDAEIRQLEGKN